MDQILDYRFRRVVDLLGLDKNDLDDPHVPVKVMFLYDWGEKKSQSIKSMDVINSISKLRKNMGITLRGKPLLVDMYKWARMDGNKIIDQEIKEVEEDKKVAFNKSNRLAKKSNIEKQKMWEDVKKSFVKQARKTELENEYRVNILKRLQEKESKEFRNEDMPLDRGHKPSTRQWEVEV
jgi:hypothetical protein